MENQTDVNLPKCPYCDFRGPDRQTQKAHLIEDHRSQLVKLASQYSQTVNLATGCVAFCFEK